MPVGPRQDRNFHLQSDRIMGSARGGTELPYGCSSDSWHQAMRAESSQGRAKEHRPRTSRHAIKVMAKAKAERKRPSFPISILHRESM